MLVLSRKTGESLTIGFDGKTVTVTILEIRGDFVRLGTEAPREIAVDRSEIAAIKKQRNEKSKRT